MHQKAKEREWIIFRQRRDKSERKMFDEIMSYSRLYNAGVIGEVHDLDAEVVVTKRGVVDKISFTCQRIKLSVMMGIKYGSTLLKMRPSSLRETEAILFSPLFHNFVLTAYKDVILSAIMVNKK